RNRAGRADGEALAVRVAPAHVDRPRAVRARIAEGAEAEARRGALVRALVGRRGDGRVHVLHGHAGRVLADTAVLVLDLALHRADAVVGSRARRARRAAVRAVARAAVEGELERV